MPAFGYDLYMIAFDLCVSYIQLFQAETLKKQVEPQLYQKNHFLKLKFSFISLKTKCFFQITIKISMKEPLQQVSVRERYIGMGRFSRVDENLVAIRILTYRLIGLLVSKSHDFKSFSKRGPGQLRLSQLTQN